jgi:hypothetical protein
MIAGTARRLRERPKDRCGGGASPFCTFDPVTNRENYLNDLWAKANAASRQGRDPSDAKGSRSAFVTGGMPARASPAENGPHPRCTINPPGSRD